VLGTTLEGRLNYERDVHKPDLEYANALIALGRAAAYIVSHRQTMRFARELPKNRRRTEVSVPYCGSPVPSAGTLKTLKI
jgi:hypothetical protein